MARYEIAINYATKKDSRVWECYQGLTKLAWERFISHRKGSGLPTLLIRIFRLEVQILWL